VAKEANMNIVAKRQSKEKRGRVNFDGKACWVSVDVHKASYAVAILDEEGQRLEFSTPAEPRKLLLQLLDMGMTIKALAYESGPTSMVVWQRSTNGAIPGKLDCSPADILLADGKRYTLIGCVDVGTRRARLQVAESSNSLAVCALLRRSLLDFGVTDAVKMDNGKEYANFLVTTALLDLGIHIDWCTPFTPEEKPHIERFFLTFQRSLTTMQGFIGHSVADRKAIESRHSFAERMSRKSGEKPALELRTSP